MRRHSFHAAKQAETPSTIWYALGVGGVFAIILMVASSSSSASPESSPEPAPKARRVAVAPSSVAVTPAPAPAPAPALASRISTSPAPNSLLLDSAREERRVLDDDTRLRKASFGDAERAEKAGRFQEALDSLDEAERQGAVKADMEPIRTRLQAELADATTIDQAIARAETAAAAGEHDKALAALRSVRELAQRVGRGAELDERLDKATAARKQAENLVLATRACERADQFLGGRDAAAARVEVEKARALVPDSPQLQKIEARLSALERTPQGMVYVELADDKGIFVRKKPVTNAELQRWIEATGKKAAAPWQKYPVEAADLPVLGVFADEAQHYALWKGERLPNEREWPAIRKALHLVLEDGRAQAGIFTRGFFTVKEP
jgi:hypothetical protein